MSVKVLKSGEGELISRRLAANEVFNWLKLFKTHCFIIMGVFVFLLILSSLKTAGKFVMPVGVLGIFLPAFFLNKVEKEMVKLKERYGL